MDSILQTTLASIVQQLADFFGMTTEVIMQNAPAWLAKYGWFTLMQRLVAVIFLWAFILATVLVVIIWIGSTLHWRTKRTVVICIIGLILTTLVVFIPWFLQCAIAPELYGLRALLTLLQ